MAEIQTTKAVKFRILPRLLDHIGLAMYSSVPKAISELVANSHDANASEVFVVLHEDKGKLCEIVIHDTGNGMSPEVVENAYLLLGYNKRQEVRQGGPKRKPIGNKGIGKLAGLGIARTMQVTSINDGKKTTVLISRDHFEDKTAELGEISFPMTIEGTGEQPSRVSCYGIWPDG